MKKLFVVSLFALAGFGVTPNVTAGGLGGTDVDATFELTITSVVCTGAGAQCPVTISQQKSVTKNAIGDFYQVDLKKYPATALGAIAKDTTKSLAIPLQKFEVKSYSFKPTQVTSKELAGGKLIYFAFYNEPQRPGTPNAGKQVVRIVRLIEGQNPNLWVDLGEFKAPKLPANRKYVLKPNGTLVDPKGVEIDLAAPTPASK